MATESRRACAQLLLRVEPTERDRIRAAIPRGSFNAVAAQLIMDYVRLIEANADSPQLPLEDTAA